MEETNSNLIPVDTLVSRPIRELSVENQTSSYDTTFLQMVSGTFPEQFAQLAALSASFSDHFAEHLASHQTTQESFAAFGQKMLELDRKKAQLTIQTALSSARAVRNELETMLLSSGPIHPYEKAIYDYCGENFICPKITDLELPSNFSSTSTLQALDVLTTKTFQNTLTHFNYITASAGKEGCEDDPFKMTNLGNFFTTLTMTDEGPQFIEQKEKFASYLAFAETVRNIPSEYIIKHPVDTAQRLLHQFLKIMSD